MYKRQATYSSKYGIVIPATLSFGHFIKKQEANIAEAIVVKMHTLRTPRNFRLHILTAAPPSIVPNTALGIAPAPSLTN